MARRLLSDTGYYHITTRSAGQIALFEDDEDRRFYLRLLKKAKNESRVSILAWVLMTDHVHLVIDTGDMPERVSMFMHILDAGYTRYFNDKTNRSGTLFQSRFWSKPVTTDAQLMATVYYVHMNPERARLGGMREYRWSSYQEYAGKHWVVDTEMILDLFGGFSSFDAYAGSPEDVVRQRMRGLQDGDVLRLAVRVSGVTRTDDLRALPVLHRNDVMRTLQHAGATTRQIARTFGIGSSTVSRVLKAS